MSVPISRKTQTDICHNLKYLIPRCTNTSFLLTQFYTSPHKIHTTCIHPFLWGTVSSGNCGRTLYCGLSLHEEWPRYRFLDFFHIFHYFHNFSSILSLFQVINFYLMVIYLTSFMFFSSHSLHTFTFPPFFSFLFFIHFFRFAFLPPLHVGVYIVICDICEK